MALFCSGQLYPCVNKAALGTVALLCPSASCDPILKALLVVFLCINHKFNPRKCSWPPQLSMFIFSAAGRKMELWCRFTVKPKLLACFMVWPIFLPSVVH